MLLAFLILWECDMTICLGPQGISPPGGGGGGILKNLLDVAHFIRGKLVILAIRK
jgi:hypothetical protein